MPCDAKLSIAASTDISDVSEIGMCNDRFQVEVARPKAINPPKSMLSPTGFIVRHEGAISSECTVPVLMRIAQMEPNSLLVSPSA